MAMIGAEVAKGIFSTKAPNKPANEGFWGVVLLGIAMIAILETSGNKPGPGTYIAVLLYIALGGLYPPIGIAVGGVILLKLLLTHGQNIGNTLTTITSSGNAWTKPSTTQQTNGITTAASSGNAWTKVGGTP